jgi:hypothetical protein
MSIESGKILNENTFGSIEPFLRGQLTLSHWDVRIQLNMVAEKIREFVRLYKESRIDRDKTEYLVNLKVLNDVFGYIFRGNRFFFENYRNNAILSSIKDSSYYQTEDGVKENRSIR